MQNISKCGRKKVKAIFTKRRIRGIIEKYE